MLTGAAPQAAPADLIKDSDQTKFAKDVIEASRTVPVIVDFWAPWCGPCKTLQPMIEKVVKEAKGAVKLVKIDIDKNQMLAQQLRIQSIPTVYAFFDGKPVEGSGDLPRLVGGTKPGASSIAQVWRNGATRDIAVTVAELNDDLADPRRSRRGGGAPEAQRRRLPVAAVQIEALDVEGLGAGAAQQLDRVQQQHDGERADQVQARQGLFVGNQFHAGGPGRAESADRRM